MLKGDISKYQSYQIWFVGQLDFDAGSALSWLPVGTPFVITSHSLNRETGDSSVNRKLQVKLSIVERVIEALKYECFAVVGDDTKWATKSESNLLNCCT